MQSKCQSSDTKDRNGYSIIPNFTIFSELNETSKDFLEVPRFYQAPGG